jgi:hypothetical protein
MIGGEGTDSKKRDIENIEKEERREERRETKKKRR